MSFRVRALAVALFLSLALPSVAFAQEEPLPKLTLMGGYSYMLDRSWDEKLPAGWVAAVSYRLGERVSVVGEGSGSYGKYLATDFTIERYAFLGGIKLQNNAESLRPFVQVLAGLSRQAGDVGILNGFILQPGGGVDLRLTERISARAFADYRFLREDGVRWNQYRVGGGVVITLWR